MRYKDIKKIIVREENKELPTKDAYIVLVRFTDDSQIRIGPIPVDVLTSTDFREKLIARLKLSYNELIVSRFYIEGEPGSKYPFDVLKRDEIADPDDVDAVPDFSDDNSDTSDIGEIEPQDGDATSSDDDKQEFPVQTGSFVATTADQAERHNAWADRVDKDRDNKHDETGKEVTRMNDQGKLVDADGNILDTPYNNINIPTYDPSEFGGGSEGEEGEGGEEGIEGTSEIVSDLFDAMRGLGTGETKLINALKQIKSSVHLNQVIKMYRETHNSSMPNDIINEFFYDLGKNTPNVIKEVNEIMVPLGWKLIGMRFSTLRWEKVGNE